MLNAIDRALDAELLNVLMSMVHGDNVVLCDVSHPAATIASATVTGKVVHMSGCDLERAAEVILSLMPFDTFLEAQVFRMKVVDDPERSCRSLPRSKRGPTGPKVARSRWPPWTASRSKQPRNRPTRSCAPPTRAPTDA